MLVAKETNELERIERALKGEGNASQRRTAEGNREYYSHLRRTLEIYDSVVRRRRNTDVNLEGEAFGRLRSLAGRALDELGGQTNPAPVSLKEYDHERYGPFLGISDEGGATAAVCSAALSSPKMQVLGHAEPLEVGVALDAERLAAVGEVAVGPDEYREIRLGSIGRILTSTNVGTRLNLRYYKERPRIDLPVGSIDEVVAFATTRAAALLGPFCNTPDQKPRPLTVFVNFKKGVRRERRIEVLGRLRVAFEEGRFCNPRVHKLGLLTYVRRGWIGVKATEAIVGLASEAGLDEVAVQGVVRRAAEEKISMPGLLNFFNATQTSHLLRSARKQRIRLTPWNQVDPDTVARHVWAPLRVARNMGLELGKYGLFPLTLKQSEIVMGLVQGWFKSWSAAPVLYVDFPIVDSTRVYTEQQIVPGVRRWLRLVAKHEIPVVLIDTADKAKGRRILKRSPHDRVGILTRAEIANLDAYASDLSIKVLWAGGLTIPQAYEMGQLKVFGIYVTTSVSASRPVTGTYLWDQMLASAKEPTREGVERVKLLLEAGFLEACLREQGQTKQAEALDRQAQILLGLLGLEPQQDRVLSAHQSLFDLAAQAWEVVLSDSQSHGGDGI